MGWVGAVEGADLHAGGRVVLTGFVGAATVTIFGSQATALPLSSLAGSVREGRVVALGGAMLTVETDTAAVEERLRSGGLACPGCAGVLTGWGLARSQTVRGPDGGVAVRSSPPPGGEHHPHRLEEQDHAAGDRRGADGEVQQDTQQLAEHDQDQGHGGRRDQHLPLHAPLGCRVKRRRDLHKRDKCQLDPIPINNTKRCRSRLEG